MEGEGVAREDSLDEIAELPLDTDLACLPGGCSVAAPAKLPKVRVGLIGDDCILQNFNMEPQMLNCESYRLNKTIS